MNIVLINSFYFPYGKGGAERSLKAIADELSYEGSSVTVLCCSDKNYCEVVDGVTVYYLKVNPFLGKGSFFYKVAFHFIDFFNFYSLYKVLKLTKRINPDVINYNNLYGFSPSVLLVGRLLKIKAILTVRDYYGLCVKSSLFHKGCRNKQGFTCRLFTLLKRVLFNCCVENVVANSKKTLDIFKESGYFLGRTESKYIYNGLDLSKSIRSEKFSWELNGEKLKVGFFGKVCKDKGFEVFFDAANEVDANFLIAGDWAINDLDSSDMPSKFEYLGFISPSEMFNKIDVLVVPSLWHDPLPRSVFEAMSFGIPVVGSDRGGIPEAILSGSGWIYRADERGELRDILNDIVSYKYHLSKYSNSAKNNSKRFSQKLTVENYLALYSEISKS